MRPLVDIVRDPPAKPEDFRLTFSEDELSDIDRGLRIAVWALYRGKCGGLMAQRLDAIVKKIEGRP